MTVDTFQISRQSKHPKRTTVTRVPTPTPTTVRAVRGGAGGVGGVGGCAGGRLGGAGVACGAGDIPATVPDRNDTSCIIKDMGPLSGNILGTIMRNYHIDPYVHS